VTVQLELSLLPAYLNFSSRGQGSFPAWTPGNGVPKVILTVGTTFKPALGELYKKHPVCTKIRLYLRVKIEK